MCIRDRYWPGEKSFAGRTAVYYGPVLLALDTAAYRPPNDKVVLRACDLERMQVTAGVDEDRWLLSTVPAADGTPVRLVDFATYFSLKSATKAAFLKRSEISRK